MTILEAISARHSARTYLPTPVSDTDLAILQKIIDDEHSCNLTLLPGGDLGRMATYGVISGRPAYIIVHGSDARQAAFEAEGSVLAATAAGFGTCWLGGTFRPGTFKDSGVTPAGNVHAVIAVGRPAERPARLDRIMRSLAKSASRKPAGKLFFEGTIDAPVAADADGKALDPALEALRLAPSASNRQPWRVIVTPDNRYNLYLTANDRYAPLDAGIALRHLVIATGRTATDAPSGSTPPSWHYIATV